jgi:hypothetical protein
MLAPSQHGGGSVPRTRPWCPKQRQGRLSRLRNRRSASATGSYARCTEIGRRPVRRALFACRLCGMYLSILEQIAFFVHELRPDSFMIRRRNVQSVVKDFQPLHRLS